MEDNNGFDYEEIEVARFFSNKMFDELMDMKDDDFFKLHYQKRCRF